MKLLVITHAFPPSIHSNAKRPYYLVKGFLDAGWEVTVVTTHLLMDPTLEETVSHPRLTIDRRKDLLLDSLEGLRNTGRIGQFASKVAYGLVWPDFFRRWVGKIAANRGLIERHDRVLAFVFPPSVLMAGKNPGVVNGNWIFDFQESVTPQYEKYPRRSPLARKLHGRLETIEKRTLNQAGRVVFTADTNRQEYLRRGILSEERTAHIPYFYDTASFQGVVPLRAGFEVCYFGGFDLNGFRTPEVFLKSLAAFLKECPEARSETKFVFRGPWRDNHWEIVRGLGLEDVCDIQTSVSYEDYITLVRTSAILLLVVAEEHNFFMPSKIVDYLGARRPVLSYVPSGSEMAGVLAEAGMGDFCGDVESVGQGTKALKKLWGLYQSKELEESFEGGRWWSMEEQFPRYRKLVEESVMEGGQ